MIRIAQYVVFMVFLVPLTGCVSTSLVQQMQSDIEDLQDRQASLENRLKELEGEREEKDEPAVDEAVPEDLAVEPGESRGTGEKAVVLQPVATPAVEEASAVYDRALEKYRSGAFREAAAQFEQAMVLTTDRDMTARCLYWLGECYYAQNSHARALEFFRRVVDEYPGETKAPDAFLKIGFTYYEMKDYNRAMQLLTEFLEKYPDHRAVVLAREKLQAIETERR